MKDGKIFERMAAVMAATTAIAKGQKNQQQGFQYRGIDDIYNSMHSILAENKIFMTTEVVDRWREERTTPKGGTLAFTILRIKFTFWTDDGSNVSSIVDGEGMDSGDKSSNKALAIGHKYALLQAFCIPTAEIKDPDAECHEVRPKAISEDQAANIDALVTELGVDLEKFLTWCRVPSIYDIPAKNYNSVIAKLEERRGK